MIKDKFETIDEGRGSEAHKKHLKKELKKNLNILRLKKMNLTELGDRAEKLLDQYETDPSDEIREELTLIQKLLKVFIKANKKQ